MSKNPCIQAGIKGFKPPTPFKVSAQFLTTDQSLDFSWLTMAKLNEDLFLYPWSFGKEFDANLTSDTEIVSQGFYTGPPPSAPKYSAPTSPPANVLAKQIIASSYQLFFISNPIGSGDVREWRLEQVAFDATVFLYSSCLMDGRYLVDFYLPHPSDLRYNAINRRFLLQHHSQEDIISPTSSAYTHYIRPLETIEAFARQHHLLPYRKFLNLTHSDTYILRSFDFTTIRGRKSRDRIPQSAWDVLKSHSDMFHSPIPRFDVPTYSIHVD
jgi:hypothetical protein